MFISFEGVRKVRSLQGLDALERSCISHRPRGTQNPKLSNKLLESGSLIIVGLGLSLFGDFGVDTEAALRLRVDLRRGPVLGLSEKGFGLGEANRQFRTTSRANKWHPIRLYCRTVRMTKSHSAFGEMLGGCPCVPSLPSRNWR